MIKLDLGGFVAAAAYRVNQGSQVSTVANPLHPASPPSTHTSPDLAEISQAGSIWTNGQCYCPGLVGFLHTHPKQQLHA